MPCRNARRLARKPPWSRRTPAGGLLKATLRHSAPKAKAKAKETPDLDTLRDEIKIMATHIAEGDSDECADEFDDLLEDFKVRTVTKLNDDDVEDFHAEAKKIVAKYYELED